MLSPLTQKVQLLSCMSDFEQKADSLSRAIQHVWNKSVRFRHHKLLQLVKCPLPVYPNTRQPRSLRRGHSSLEFHNKSFRGIVEAIVKEDPQYRVSFSNGIVDIFSPMAREDSSNLLNRIIKDFSVTEMETGWPILNYSALS